MADESEKQKLIKHLSLWGRQTVAFALSVKAQKIGKPIDCDARAMAAGKETDATSQELWDAALNECKKPVKPEEMTMKFAEKVFDWVNGHIYD